MVTSAPKWHSIILVGGSLILVAVGMSCSNRNLPTSGNANATSPTGRTNSPMVTGEPMRANNISTKINDYIAEVMPTLREAGATGVTMRAGNRGGTNCVVIEGVVVDQSELNVLHTFLGISNFLATPPAPLVFEVKLQDGK